MRDAMAMAVTFAATLLVELEFAIYFGVLLSLVLHVHMISKPEFEPLSVSEFLAKGNEEFKDEPCLKDTAIYRINGSFFFGSVDHINSEITQILNNDREIKHLIIVGSGINFIDITGAEALRSECKRIKDRGINLYLARMKEGAMRLVRRGDYLTEFEHCIFDTQQAAIKHIIDSCRR